MWPVTASASGFAGDEGTPRNAGRGGRADAGRGGRPAAGGSAGPDDHRAGDLSQEEILDLVVEAMLAAGGPGAEDDDLGDDDGVDADSLWGTRDAPGPPGTGKQDTGEQAPGPGPGFGSGQPFDVARPGPALAGEADRVHTGALRRVSDEELTGMIRAWRRLSSWATARELGAIAEFARRRPDEDPGPGTDSDVARRARARRAASNPPGAAKQAGSAQAAQSGGASPAAQGAPAASAGRVNPAAQDAPADGTAGATSAAQGAPAAPAAPAGGATPAAQAAAAAPAGGANPAAAAGAPAGGRPGTGPGFPEVIDPGG